MISKCEIISDRINVLENQLRNVVSCSWKKSDRKSGIIQELDNMEYTEKTLQFENKNQEKFQFEPINEKLTSKGYWNNVFKNQAEKELNTKNDPVPLISIKNPPLIDRKLYCECMKRNPFNISATLATNEDKKFVDNTIIDCLRTEIEKVRNKLTEIGTRPVQHEDSTSQVSKEQIITTTETNSVGDSSKNLSESIRELQRKNDELSQQLKEHKKLHESSLKKAEDATKLLNSYETKVNALHEQALKSSKMMTQSKEKFCDILRSRNCQIKTLYEVNQQLKSTISSNNEHMKQLKNTYKLLKSRYKEIETKEKESRSENSKLKENMKKLETEFRTAYKECSRLKSENEKLIKKLNDLEKDVSNEYGQKLTKQGDYLNNLMLDSKKSEARMFVEVLGMSEQLQMNHNELNEMKSEINAETSELRSKYQTLLHQYEALVKKFYDYEKFDEIKCSCIEKELKEFSLKMKEKEGIILRERDGLRKMLEELTWTLKQNKIEMNQLNMENNEQEGIIANLNKILKSKDAEMMECRKELNESRQQCWNLGKEIETLKKSLSENTTNSNNEDHLMQELVKINQLLNKEKDANMIKQKIIEDHESTIRVLKEQVNEKSKELDKTIENLHIVTREMTRITEHLRLVQKDLEVEKQEKDKLINELKDINVHKEILTKNVMKLEETVQNQCLRAERNIRSEDKLTIDKLEQQIKQQKQEWDIQRRILQKDKEKALHAAKFASQKLLDSVNDFQKQMCEQKEAQAKLAALLQGKEKQLESLTQKVKCLIPLEEVCGNNRSDCQIQEIFAGPKHMHKSGESFNGKVMKSYASKDSCSACCYYSDN